MKIITWNVNGIRASAKKGLLGFVEQERPDILCLQETKAHLEQVEPAIQSLGYPHFYWSSAIKKGYSGVATFTHRAPTNIQRGWGLEQYDSEGRIVITDHGHFLLYNIYFPNGGSGQVRHEFKQLFLRDLSEHMSSVLAQGREVILVGDYNVAHQEKDIYDPLRLAKESGFLLEERQWFDSFLGLGFFDAFRELHPETTNKYTWWDYRQFARVANRGWRIDYICLTKGLKKALRSAEVLDQVEGSDHCPVMIELEV
jgi:exodeoxyribonuclease-3